MASIEQIFAPLADLLDEEERENLITEIVEMKKQYGASWMAYFQEEYPEYLVLIDAAANKTTEEAIPYLKAFAIGELEKAGFEGLSLLGGRIAVSGFLKANTAWLLEMHSRIKAEIDKPRF